MNTRSRLTLGLVCAAVLAAALPGSHAVALLSGSGNRSISGTVSDQNGPIAGVCVVAWLHYQYPTHWHMRMGIAVTDDLGRYAIGRLPPEAYVVRFMGCREGAHGEPLDSWPEYPGTKIMAEWWNDQPSWGLAQHIDVTAGDVSGIDAQVRRVR